MSDTTANRAADGAAGSVEVPLAAILAKLPPAMAWLIASEPPAGATLKIPTDALMRQLAAGSVKVTLAELRRAAPPGVLADGGTDDSAHVTVPLGDVLAKMDRALLARKPDQKTAFLPADMKPPFLRKGDPAIQAAAAAEAEKHAGAPATTQHHPHAPKPATAVARPSGTAAFLKASISELSTGWPEGLRREINVLGIAGLALPTDDIGAALKTGRVTYPWKLLRTWAMPAAILKPSAYDESLLTLPLSVITPLFLSAQNRAASQSTPGPTVTQAPTRPKLTPADFVRSVLMLPGVSGAFVASKQGLIVAQQMPSGNPADRIASMLSQNFERITQAVQGMNLGAVVSLGLNASGVPWLLYGAGNFRVGVVGRANEPMPATQLQMLVTELGR